MNHAKQNMSVNVAELVSVAEFEEQAKLILPKNVFDYYIKSGGQGQTYRANMNSFTRLNLLPRLMRDVSVRDLSTTIQGQHLPFPIAIAPTAKHCLAHSDGELATAKGAEPVNTGMVLSTWSTKSIEDVATAAPNGPKWLQLANYNDREIVADLIRRAEKVGFKGIVMTIDSALVARKKTFYKRLPDSLRYENFAAYHFSEEELHTDALIAKLKDLTLTWDFIDWLKSVTALPIILKGILTASDARNAVKHKADGILVSNHGGRLLDGVPATIDVLPDIVNAVRGSGVEVYLDGGIRTGTDVLKAIALGAKAVFIGRPALWGLACGGADGVRRILEILRDELDSAMALMGCTNLAEITPDLIQKQTSNL